MIHATATKLIIKEVKSKTENTSVGGIILSSGNDNTTKAEIVSVGPACVGKFKVGDVVVPVWAQVQHLRLDGVDMFGIDEQHILGVIK